MEYVLKNGKIIDIAIPYVEKLKESVKAKRIQMSLDFLEMYECGFRNDIIFERLSKKYFLQNYKSFYTLINIPYLKKIIDNNK